MIKSEFSGLDKIIVDDDGNAVSVILEGQHPLVKFEIKKNNNKWSVRNSETGKIYYVKMNDLAPEANMHDFLSGVGAYHDVMTAKTKSPVNYNELTKQCCLNSGMTFWIRANKEQIIRDTYAHILNHRRTATQAEVSPVQGHPTVVTLENKRLTEASGAITELYKALVKFSNIQKDLNKPAEDILEEVNELIDVIEDKYL